MEIENKILEIKEEDLEQEEWYKAAKNMTVDRLPEFIRHLTKDYKHDYGTICHAVAASGLAAMHAMNKTPIGGITGFQAGCVMWEVIQRWMNFSGPLKLIEFENMLYPQFEHKFEKTISKTTWEYLQKRAKEFLAARTDAAAKTVVDHWKSVAEGNIPFGFKIDENE